MAVKATCAPLSPDPQRAAVAADGTSRSISRFGTHHGVEAQMLLGEGGMGVTGSPSPHYNTVENTCVACHMGEENNHTYQPTVERCQACHDGAEDFDINGVRTDVTAMVDELTTIFVQKGMLDPETSLWASTP
jgi:hypothetical protein